MEREDKFLSTEGGCLSDEEVAVRVQEGKSDYFGLLIERYEQKLLRYSRKFLNDDEEAKDMVQETFLKAYKNIKGFDAERKFSPWIYRIAHNEMVNALKRKGRVPVVSFDLDTFLPYYTHDKKELEREIDRREMKDVVDKCLNKLPSKYRWPVVLYYLEELSYREIADVLEVPISTVGIRIKRAKEKIKKTCEKMNYDL